MAEIPCTAIRGSALRQVPSAKKDLISYFWGLRMRSLCAITLATSFAFVHCANAEVRDDHEREAGAQCETSPRDDPLNDITNPNLRYFGMWGALNGRFDGNLAPISFYESLPHYEHQLVMVGAYWAGVDYCTDINNGLEERICLLDVHLQEVLRLGRPNFKVVMLIDEIFFFDAGHGVKYLRSSIYPGTGDGRDLLTEANRLLPNPVVVEHDARYTEGENRVRAEIKAGWKALKYLLFDDNPRGEIYKDLIEIIYVIDEPYLGATDETFKNVRGGWQEWILEQIRLDEDFAGIRTMVNYSVLQLEAMHQRPSGTAYHINASYDYVAFDCYKDCTFYRSQDQRRSIVEYMEILREKKHSHQRIFMIPYIGAQLPLSDCDCGYAYTHSIWVSCILMDYFNYAADSMNDDVVGLLPFGWADGVYSDSWCGAYRFLHQVHVLKQISARISNNR